MNVSHFWKVLSESNALCPEKRCCPKICPKIAPFPCPKNGLGQFLMNVSRFCTFWAPRNNTFLYRNRCESLACPKSPRKYLFPEVGCRQGVPTGLPEKVRRLPWTNWPYNLWKHTVFVKIHKSCACSPRPSDGHGQANLYWLIFNAKSMAPQSLRPRPIGSTYSWA